MKTNLINIKTITVATLLSFVAQPFIVNAQNVQTALQDMYGERFQSATGTITKIVKSSPNDPQNYYYAGYIYLYTQKPDSAKYFFDKGIALDKDAPLNYVGKGYLALNANDTTTAKSLFKKAIDLSKPKNKAVVYNQIANALIHAKSKNIKQALTYLNKSLTEKKNSYANRITAETKMLMGDAYLALFDGGNAVTNYEAAMQLDKSLAAMMHTKVGEIWLSARNGDAALTEFNAAQQADPNYAPVYKDLGETYFTYKRDFTKAKAMYQKYLHLSDISTGSQDRYAEFLYVSKDYVNAIAKMKEVLKTDPKNVEMKRLLGYSYYKTKKYDSAASAFEDYFKLAKTKDLISSDFGLYGKSLFETGKDSLGMINIKKAVEKDSTKIDEVKIFADTLSDHKKYTQAADLYTYYLATKKNVTAQDYYAGGRVYLLAKQFPNADSSFAKLIALSPKNYIGYYMTAITKYYEDPSGAKGLAKSYYEKTIAITESKPQKFKSILINAYTYLATYYTTKEKNLATAKSYWEKVQALDPANINAKKFMEYYNKVQAYNAQQKKAAANKSR